MWLSVQPQEKRALIKTVCFLSFYLNSVVTAHIYELILFVHSPLASSFISVI